MENNYRVNGSFKIIQDSIDSFAQRIEQQNKVIDEILDSIQKSRKEIKDITKNISGGFKY